ncbi:MAG: heterodisulfide reductase-related iron-sulfur binding cluster [Thermaerobacter sp.]|nr:heterodisulfide reductase-related iron-sulfur binding cluster [Thermaerobacter sp.]
MKGISQEDKNPSNVVHYAGCQAAVVLHERFLSTEQIADGLGVEMERLAPDDCCGGVEDPPNFFSGIVAPLRIIDLAGEHQLVTSCLSCLANLRGAFNRMEQNPETRRRAIFSMQVVGYEAPESTSARHLLDLLAEQNLAQLIDTRKTTDLDDFPVALYYGCRKAELAAGTAAELELSLEQAGAQIVPFPDAESCCGAPKGYGNGLPGGKGQEVLKKAAQTGAQAVVTVCGMCQANLEKQQTDLLVIPFLQLMAVSLGMADPKVWLKKFDSVEGG